MDIRTAQQHDRVQWLRMRQRLWPGGEHEHAMEIDRALGECREDMVVFVIEVESGQLCGFIEVAIRPYAAGCCSSPVGYIEGLWVDVEHRREGMAAALVAAAERWASSKGLTEMASDTQITNLDSHATHQALGYEETERIICYRKSLAVGQSINCK